MPLASTVSVLIDSREAADVATWLSRRAPTEPTALGLAADGNAAGNEEALKSLCRQLEKAGRSARGRRWISIKRAAASAYVSAAAPYWPSFGRGQPRAVRKLYRRLRMKLARRAGRPALGLNGLRRVADNSLTPCYDERERKRARRRLRLAEAQEAGREAFELWFAEVQRRGETILTTSLPLPETP